jgi:hypothetical protein
MGDKNNLIIRYGSDKKGITFSKLTEVLSNVQTIIFSIGSYVESGRLRKCGDFTKKVRENCELKVISVKNGSVQIEARLPEVVQATLASETTGERAMSIFSDLVDGIESEGYANKVEKLIPEPGSRKRILELFEKTIPEDPEEYLHIESGKHKNTLKPEYRQKINSIIPTISIPDSKKVTGRLMELRVDDKRKFQIDTQEGIIRGEYTANLEDFFKTSIGKIVTLEGKLNPREPKLSLFISDKSNYTTLDKYPLSDIILDRKGKTITKPFELEITFENDEYLFYESEFRLVGIGKTFKDGINNIQKQFAILWSEYVKAPEHNFAKDAKELRKRLIQRLQ